MDTALLAPCILNNLSVLDKDVPQYEHFYLFVCLVRKKVMFE